MVLILLRKDHVIGRDAPIDRQLGIVPCDSTLTAGSVVIIALVLEDHFWREYAEAVCEASGNEELAMITFTQLHGYVLSEGLRPTADVDSYIEDGATDDTYQLALSVGRELVMQATDDAVAREAFVILDKFRGTDLLSEGSCTERLEEVATIVPEDTGL